MTHFHLFAGDCLSHMTVLKNESIDHIICDPPYEIGFMNKGWDNTGIAYNPKTWESCHKVLKENGVLLVFGATRTHHRIAHAIERAGFRIVDILAWCYGSGFPKSLNISKAIDKRGGKEISWFGQWFKKWRLSQGIKQKDIAKLFPSKQKYAGSEASGKLTGCVGNWESGYSIPTNEQFNLLCETFDLPFRNLEEAEREIVGSKKVGYQSKDGAFNENTCGFKKGVVDITLPSTENAKQWAGWGTALKPAFEPIIVAVKKESSYEPKGYSQFHYVAKASKKERNAGLHDFPVSGKKRHWAQSAGKTDAGKQVSSFPVANHHPTVKPVKLMERLILDFTKEGEKIYDPFMGSGTTGIASVNMGRSFIGSDAEGEYLDIATSRINHALKLKEGESNEIRTV